MNLVVIKGNLTRDPELRYLPNGTAVCGFGLAVNRKWKDQNGSRSEAAQPDSEDGGHQLDASDDAPF